MICIGEENIYEHQSYRKQPCGFHKQISAESHRSNTHYTAHSVKHQCRSTLSVSKFHQPMVQMSLVSLHYRSFIYQPSENRKCRIENRHSEHEHGYYDSHYRGTLYRSEYRHRGKHKAQEQRTSVTHKNLCRVKIVRQKSECTARKCEHCPCCQIHTVDICHIRYAKRGNRRSTRSQAVKPVYEVYGIRYSDYPHYCNDETKCGTQLAFSDTEEVAQKLDTDTVHIHYNRYHRLSEELDFCRQIFEIVHYSQNINQNAAYQNSDNAVVELHQKYRRRNRCTCEYRKSAESWHRFCVHSSGIFGDIHSPYLGCQLHSYRCHNHRQHECQQKCHPKCTVHICFPLFFPFVMYYLLLFIEP